LTSCDINKILPVVEHFREKGYSLEPLENKVSLFDRDYPFVRLVIMVLDNSIKISVSIDKGKLLDNIEDDDSLEHVQKLVDELSLQADIIASFLSPVCRVEKDLDSVMDAYMQLESILEEI